MKEYFIDLWDMLTEPLDGWLDGTMRVLISVCVLAFIGLLFWGIFYLADSTFREKKEGVGTISGRSFSPAHTTTTFMHVGKSMVPITHYHPDSWYVFIKLDDNEDDVQVSESYYDWAAKGGNVKIKYKTGRISGGLYITEILP